MDMCKYTPLSMNKILSTLNSEKICNLGTMNCDTVKIVPMWYIFSYENNVLTFYFISNNYGEKITNMKTNSVACISLNSSYTKCDKKFFKSIVANGKAELIHNNYEKSYIIAEFNNKYGYNNGLLCSCTENDLDFIKIVTYNITGRLY